MENQETRKERMELIRTLTGLLSVLRAAVGISQGELAECIGISRQTYCALEQGKRDMSWGTFLSLFLFFISNEETYGLLKVNKGFIAKVYKALQFRPDETVQCPLGIDK
jgi:DNA-binding XRE family transcriptional regulator